MKIEIYGAEWCTFCKEAVALCKRNSLEYNYIDIDTSTNLKSLEERIGSKVRTIPQIFKDGEFLPGGFNGLQQELAKN